MQDILRIVDKADNLIVVDKPDLSAIDRNACARVTAKHNPVALFAPRPGWELLTIGIGQRSKF